MKDVVITAGTAVGSVLALAEGIKKEVSCKIYVICTNQKTSNILRSSRLVDEVFYFNYGNPEEYVLEIKRWHKSKNFMQCPVLYSTTDSSCYLIDQGRQWFEENFELTLPSSKIITTFTQKGLAELAAEKAGLNIPRTTVLRQVGCIERQVETFNFPVILKPCATYLKGDIDFKIKVVESAERLSKQAAKYLENGNTLLCQEFIPGGNDTAYYYLFYRSKSGKVYRSMGKKILQSTKNGGIMLKGKSKYDAHLDQQCRSFLKSINYEGMGGIEFKKNNGVFYFIEMSVRLEGFFKLAEISDVPLSLISYYNNKDHQSKEIHQKNDVIYISWASTMISHINNKRITPFVSDLINSVVNPRYFLDVFSWSSPKPFFKEVISLLRRRH
ncbi:hypothetical protein [Halomonas sp. RA08-2]|uniref:hypothetical protein n=1 Tax=Halomonas sp. RA08-2 TaxID=3440842 RepID=UPI003EED589E